MKPQILWDQIQRNPFSFSKLLLYSKSVSDIQWCPLFTLVSVTTYFKKTNKKNISIIHYWLFTTFSSYTVYLAKWGCMFCEGVWCAHGVLAKLTQGGFWLNESCVHLSTDRISMVCLSLLHTDWLGFHTSLTSPFFPPLYFSILIVLCLTASVSLKASTARSTSPSSSDST